MKRSLKKRLRTLFESKKHVKDYPHLPPLIDQSGLRNTDVIKEIDEVLNSPTSFFFQIGLSAVIATLGLQINSAAVVIGAMLISPLFWPIVGVAVGSLSLREKIMGRSIAYLVASLILVVVISAFISYLTPLRNITEEIQIRANPTIIDMIIAIASGCIGVLVLYSKRVSSISAGLAISVALLPPLATAGIGITYGETRVAWNSFLLFLTNVNAIIFSGLSLLYILKFKHVRGFKGDVSKKTFYIISTVLFFIAIPLFFHFLVIIGKANALSSAKFVLNEGVEKISINANVEEVEILSYDYWGLNSVVIDSTLLIPENTEINLEQKERLVSELSREINKPVKLNLKVIHTVQITDQSSQADLNGENTGKKEETTEENINLQVRNLILELDNYVRIDTIKTYLPKVDVYDYENQEEVEDTFATVDITLFEPVGPQIDESTALYIEDKIYEKNDGLEADVKIHSIPIQTISD